MSADNNELMILLAGIHKQNSEILDKLSHIEKRLSTVEDTIKAQQPDRGDIWKIGYDKLKAALDAQGLEVSVVKLKKFRACNVLRVSTDKEELECRSIGTEKLDRWRFHVGNCKAAIAHFEQLSVQDQRRILAI